MQQVLHAPREGSRRLARATGTFFRGVDHRCVYTMCIGIPYGFPPIFPPRATPTVESLFRVLEFPAIWVVYYLILSQFVRIGIPYHMSRVYYS